jgi:transposase
VLDGHSREAAAEACGMDRQTLRDWVHRYNAEGLAGLTNRRAAGPTPRLSAAQEVEVAHWIEDGPNLERDGVVRWRCRDLQARIERAFGVRFHERTIGKLRDKRRFRRLSVRPPHPESDPAEQEAFKGASPSGRRPRSRRCPPARQSRSGSQMRPGYCRRSQAAWARAANRVTRVLA